MTTPLLAPSTEMVTVTFDGVPVTVPKGTLLVEAAKLVKQQIPIYCYHTKLGPAGLCRICMVEIEGMPKLQIACNTTATDGMVVRTRGEKVDAARALVLELFLVNHPLDCPICDKGGECDLQDYSMAYARGSSDVADPKLSKPKAVDLGPTIVLDEERCIVCQRCVRFDDIIADEQQLVVKDRGAARYYRNGKRSSVPAQLYRQRYRTLSGRRADVEDVSLQVAPVGSEPHADDVHAVRGRMPTVRRRAARNVTSNDVGRGRRCHLRRLALRPRAIQRRVLRIARTGEAATLPTRRRLRPNRLGRRLHSLGESDSRGDRDAWPGERRRDRRRPFDE